MLNIHETTDFLLSRMLKTDTNSCFLNSQLFLSPNVIKAKKKKKKLPNANTGDSFHTG